MKKIAQKMAMVALFLALALDPILAYETNSSNHEFEFTITSGKNNEISSSNYETFVLVGGITGSSASSNYNNRFGFLITNPFVIGEACQVHSECYSGACCNNICSSVCEDDDDDGDSGGGGGGSNSGGGGAVYNDSYVPAEADSFTHFYSSISAGSSYGKRINSNLLAVINVSFIVTEDLQNVNLRVALAKNVPLSVDDVYQYFEIWSDKLNSENIQEMRILFRIPIDRGFDPDQIKIVHYVDGSWVDLPTIQVGSDSTYYYLESMTPDIGLFAIVTKLKQGQQPKPPLEEVTGEVVQEPEPTPEPPLPIEEPATIEKTSKLFRIASLLGIVLLLIVVVMGVIAYQFTRAEEERRMTYIEFSSIVKDIYRHIDTNQMQTALALYKKLMPDYLFLMQSGHITAEAKAQIYKEFRLVYEILNSRVKDIHYNIPQEYWKR